MIPDWKQQMFDMEQAIVRRGDIQMSYEPGDLVEVMKPPLTTHTSAYQSPLNQSDWPRRVGRVVERGDWWDEYIIEFSDSTKARATIYIMQALST